MKKILNLRIKLSKNLRNTRSIDEYFAGNDTNKFCAQYEVLLTWLMTEYELN